MRLQLPAAVNMIIDVLQAHGYEGFAVGGCVRDSVLNRTPDDWDITTSATPYQVKELFSKTVDTGLQHGTVTVMVTWRRLRSDHHTGSTGNTRMADTRKRCSLPQILRKI